MPKASISLRSHGLAQMVGGPHLCHPFLYLCPSVLNDGNADKHEFPINRPFFAPEIRVHLTPLAFLCLGCTPATFGSAPLRLWSASKGQRTCPWEVLMRRERIVVILDPCARMSAEAEFSGCIEEQINSIGLPSGSNCPGRFKHFPRHGMFQLPDHFDRTV